MVIAENEPTPGAGDAPRSRSAQLAKALVHPVRLELLREISDRELSPAELARIRSEPVAAVKPHFALLESLGCIEPVDPSATGDPAHRAYRRRKTIEFDDRAWALLPLAARQIFTRSTVRELHSEMANAVRTGTFIARSDAHISWETMRLDEEGWKRIVSILGWAFGAVAETKDEARQRLAAVGEDGVNVTIALAGFEAAPDGPGEAGDETLA